MLCLGEASYDSVNYDNVNKAYTKYLIALKFLIS